MEKKEKEQNDKKSFSIKNIAIIILLAIIIILLFRSCSVSDQNNENGGLTQSIEIEDSTYVEKEVKPQEIKYIDIPLAENISVTEDYPYVTLYNPETNKDSYYLQYSVYLEGDDEPIYQSKLVEPGYKFSVNFKEILDNGEYKGIVVVSAFEMGTMATCNGVSNNITISIK